MQQRSFGKLMQVALIACLMLAMTSTALGFNGQRKGFIIGGGLGIGLTSVSQTFKVGSVSIDTDSESKAGFQSDFKIGFGATEQVLVYWSSKVSWFSADYVVYNPILDDFVAEAMTTASGFGGVGLTYYFKPVAPSPYVSGGLGFSTWALPFEEGAETYIGFGLSIGGGYEFARHWSVEGDLVWGKPSKDIGGVDVSYNPLTIRVAVVGVAY
ncbi:MAG TPA: hypothetical protein VN285_11585 [Candidatus Deferrimicrobium sp.]|nr:hypothetical protein [Candidatus Deferrimicrobium sp.]